MWLTDIRVLKKDIHPMIFQSHSPQDLASNLYSRANMPHQMNSSQLRIVSFNIWDLPYWFVKNRKPRILQIAEYLQRLDAEIICLQESFDIHHRRLLYEPEFSVLWFPLGFMQVSAHPILKAVLSQSFIHIACWPHKNPGPSDPRWGMVSFESHRADKRDEGMHHVPHPTIRQKAR